MAEKPEPSPRNVLPDLVIPAMALTFAIYYLTTITEVPWISQASAVFVSCLLFLAIFAFGIRTVLRIRRGEETLRLPGTEGVDVPVMLRRAAMLGLTIGYVFLLESLGFTIATFGFLFLGVLVLSSARNWKNALLLALVAAITGYVVFIYFFGTRFPEGIVETTLEAWLR